MELKFEKTLLRFLQTHPTQVQQQEQTQEVRLPDGMPDIGNVLGCWGQIVLRGKEWRADTAGISGGVIVWVLYQPEEGGCVQSVNAWLPFQMKWDTETGQYDGTLMVMPFLISADARCLSARKMMLRTNISVMGKIFRPAEAGVFTVGEIPEDVCLLQCTHNVCVPVEAGEKAFVLEETISLASEDTVLLCTLKPEVTEKKIMADKLIFRGIAILHLLCVGDNGNLWCKDYDLSFSQYAELDSIYEDAEIQVLPVVTELEQERMDDGTLMLKAGISGQYVVYDRRIVQVPEDAYSTQRTLQMQQEGLNLPSLREQSQNILHGETTLNVDAKQLVDVSFWPEHPYLLIGENDTEVELSGGFQVLYYDPDGILQCEQSHWEDVLKIPTEQDIAVSLIAQPSGKPRGAQDGSGIMLHGDLLLDCQKVISSEIPVVTGLELGELQPPNPDRPSLILRRMGAKSLWELAKESGSTVDAIEKANNAENLADQDRLIIIPIP